MDSFITEIQPLFQAPSEDARLVLFADEEIHEGAREVSRHLTLCARYAKTHHVFLVSGLCAYADYLWLCLFGPDGESLCRQAALHLPLQLRLALRSADQIQVVHTELGNLALCVDADIFHPQVLRAAALKGADAILSVQHLDPVEDTPERIMCSVWNASQTNNVYVVNHSIGGSTVCCPVPLTRSGDGYIIHRTAESPVRFGLNMQRLDEIRSRFQIMENINTRLVQNYRDELGR